MLVYVTIEDVKDKSSYVEITLSGSLIKNPTDCGCNHGDVDSYVPDYDDAGFLVGKECAFDGIAKKTKKDVKFNCSAITYIDESGAGVIIRFARMLLKYGGKRATVIKNLSKAMTERFIEVGLKDYLV
ncbi:MAG TPA: STAS domain-containing protein [Spirochaetota bacterium]|nr:STAS domain-containing protein [Spirochaetota bacterium]